MLTQTLRRMERDGLVCRTVFPVIPPHTEYELTELGTTLVPPLQSLCRWGNENYETVEQNRTAFDQRTYSADAGSSPAYEAKAAANSSGVLASTVVAIDHR